MTRSRHVLAMAALLAVACSAATVAAPRNAGAATGAATDKADKADKVIAQAGIITEDDLPSGYTADESTADVGGGGRATDFDKIAAKIPSCKGLLEFIQTNTKSSATAKIEGPDYELGDSQVSSQVKVFKNTKPVDAGFAVLQKPATNTCMSKLMDSTFSKVLADQAKTLPKKQRSIFDDLDITVDVLTVTLGDQATGYRTVVAVPAASLQFTIEMVFVGVDRSVASYLFMNVGGPLTFAPSVASMTTARLAAALA